MYTRAFNISVQGASHIRKNKICQDSSISFNDENIAIAIVCDGHGGDDYIRSDKGSQFAAEIALQNIKQFVANISINALKEDIEHVLRTLEASIISAWNIHVREHFEQNPFTEDEIRQLSEKARHDYLRNDKIESAYGTTIIAVVFTRTYWFGIQLGDGKCVSVNNEGVFSEPIPWNEKCFLNATTSMCEADALDNFRHFFSDVLPAAVFVGSDGIDDCFKTADQLYNLYKTVMVSFHTSKFDSAVFELKEYLPRLSAKGSGDDVSIAAVLDLAKIGKIDTVKNFNREKEKARIEENAKLAAFQIENERLQMETERAKQAEAKSLERLKDALRRAEAAENRLHTAEQRANKAEEQVHKFRSLLKKLESYLKKNGICMNCGTKWLHGSFCCVCGKPISDSGPVTSLNRLTSTESGIPTSGKLSHLEQSENKQDATIAVSAHTEQPLDIPLSHTLDSSAESHLGTASLQQTTPVETEEKQKMVVEMTVLESESTVSDIDSKFFEEPPLAETISLESATTSIENENKTDFNTIF